MHHGRDSFYALFRDVLQEIAAWARLHPSEFLFLDLDFDDDLSTRVRDTLISGIGEDQFTDLHVGPDGKYNQKLTWGDLRKGGKQFIVIWKGFSDSGKRWAPPAEKIRYNWPDNALPTDKGDPDAEGFDYEQHSAVEILHMLDKELQRWTKDILFITQVVDTPKLSFKPGHHPVDLDKAAAKQFTDFIKKHDSNSNLCIVKRDFVNASWSREAFDYVICLNKWDSTTNASPWIPELGRPLFFTDTIRLKDQDGRYLRVERKTFGTGQLSCLRLDEHSSYGDDDCNFVIRNQNFHPKEYIRYSGNKDADYSHGAPTGTCRLVTFPPNDYWPPGQTPNEEIALSVRDANVYWGIGWGASGNLESFTFFNKDNLRATTNVYDGSEILIKAMWGVAFLQATPDRYIHATGDRSKYDGTVFKIEAVWEGGPWWDPSTWVLYDPNIDP